MGAEIWIRENTRKLTEKTVAITGATGGLGRALCRYVLMLEGRLLLLTRDADKTQTLCRELLREFPQASITSVFLELTDFESVNAACHALANDPPDILCLNAGAYCLPRVKGYSGFDVVFETNFVSHYYLARALLPALAQRHGRILVTGSIAYQGAVTNAADWDFSGCTSPELVYGNSKRWLMLALTELVQKNPQVQLAIAHPGITPTGITRNYSKVHLALIRYPMKLIFSSPQKAARSLALGLEQDVPALHWIGPRVRNIWGNPTTSPLVGCQAEERARIFADAEEIFCRLKDRCS